MLLFNALILAFLFSLSLAAPKAARFGCLSEHPPPALVSAAKAMKAKEDLLCAASAAAAAAAQPSIQVDVYFHVVAASRSEADGWVPDSKLARQLAVLNAAYGPHAIRFAHRNTSRTLNALWSDGGDELGMKRALRRGPYSALNLYFVRSAVGGVMGHCDFPSPAASAAASAAALARSSSGSDLFFRDGCTVLAGSVPGGLMADYNLGHTATHEVGHWFGLFHTFQGDSCDGAGDSISDTPQQAAPTAGCPASRDSCPSKPGVDPIHNFMDYSTDVCYRNFTLGQRTRMHSMWTQFRKLR